MSSTNHRFTSFTIAQPFLGAPLHFQPALGSQELEQLIDAFVTGSSSKQEKFCEITIDFYNNATVDLNTGALIKTYHVYPTSMNVAASPWDFEQSPTQSQSSGFSPPIFTTSPGSSAANLGDSGYGSISSLTPPNRNLNGPASHRVAKKPRKETKKAAEIRLPGFSIMTKDGIDVTNSAGRGTKTKEQREHAHLMRIIKACDDCKRKKIKCDPSHRRSHTDMSRTSTSTTHSSSRPNPSSPVSVPSLSRETTNASLNSMQTFGNALDDFVLFPEDTSSWNADMPLPEDYDLSQFNFDINDIGGLNDFPGMNPDQHFYPTIDQQQSSFQFGDQLSQSHYLPNQNNLTLLDDPQSWTSVVHSRPHPATTPQDSSQQDSTRWAKDGFTVPTSVIAGAFADDFSPNSFMDHSYIASDLGTNDSPSSFSSVDWSTLESSVNANVSPQMDGHSLSLSQASSRQCRGRQNNDPVERTTMHDVQEGIQAPSEHASLRRLGEPCGSMNPSGLLLPVEGITTFMEVITSHATAVAQDITLENKGSIEVFYDQSTSNIEFDLCVGVANSMSFMPSTILLVTFIGLSIIAYAFSSPIVAFLATFVPPMAVFVLENRSQTMPRFLSLPSLAMTASLACLGFLALHNEQKEQITKTMHFIRDSCTAWTSTASSPFIDICRLVFAAIIVSQAPRIIHKVVGSIDSLSTVLTSVMTLFAVSERRIGENSALGSPRHQTKDSSREKKSVASHWLSIIRE